MGWLKRLFHKQTYAESPQLPPVTPTRLPEEEREKIHWTMGYKVVDTFEGSVKKYRTYDDMMADNPDFTDTGVKKVLRGEQKTHICCHISRCRMYD